MTRKEALQLGLTQYEGSVHAPCGTRLKQVSSYSCVHCHNKKTARQNRLAHARNLDARRRTSRKSTITKQFKAEIDEIYAEAALISALTGVEHHVDHEIPLNHPKVCGLHVPLNLVIRTKADNLSKSNKFDGNERTYKYISEALEVQVQHRQREHADLGVAGEEHDAS